MERTGTGSIEFAQRQCHGIKLNRAVEGKHALSGCRGFLGILGGARVIPAAGKLNRNHPQVGAIAHQERLGDANMGFAPFRFGNALENRLSNLGVLNFNFVVPIPGAAAHQVFRDKTGHSSRTPRIVGEQAHQDVLRQRLAGGDEESQKRASRIRQPADATLDQLRQSKAARPVRQLAPPEVGGELLE